MLSGGWNTFWVDTECLSERASSERVAVASPEGCCSRSVG